MSIRREIEVTRKGLPRPIDVTYGTNMLPLEFVITDFELPDGATVEAYAIGTSKNLVKQSCKLSGNVISFTPEIGLFEEGKNVLQLAARYEEKDLFTFYIPVNCQKTMFYEGAQDLGDDPTFVGMVMQMKQEVSNLSEQIANETTARENAVTDLNDKIDSMDVGYTLTEADKQDIAELVENVTFYERPTIVSSVEEMTDTSKQYILESTGTVWEYQSATVTQTVTEQIVGTTDNPYETGRLSSGNANGTSGYVTTPYIDLQKYSVPFTLHLKGITFSYTTYGSAVQGNLRHAQYDTSKTHLKTEMTQATAFQTYWSGAEFTDVGDGTVEILFTPPVTNKSVNVGYARFSGYGAEADANVYVEYEGTTTGYSWVDTEIVYGSGSASEEVVDITEFTLVNPSVKSFMDGEDYSDDDYSYTNVNTYTSSDYFRKDISLPIVLNWTKDAKALEYTVTINMVSSVLITGMQTYYVKDNKCVIYNLIPNTTYYYKVYGLYADSSKKLLKDGNFTTTDGTRMLNIDGIQNVRDIGGYTGYNSLKVKYGLIYRGGAMDEKVADICCITDNGKQEMLTRVGIRTDLDLRGANNVSESALGTDVDFYTPQYSYLSYTSAVTDTLHMGYFKDMLEYIVTQLTNSKPVYIHCSGGCDRTGTLVFLLLGLLGVSESDLAKEYELSSFSAIGKKTRIRNSTVYDYSGMVSAIKAYSETTITDNFVAFATDCGVSSDTITSFRNLMLG